jgi:hypothetical protein
VVGVSHGDVVGGSRGDVVGGSRGDVLGVHVVMWLGVRVVMCGVHVVMWWGVHAVMFLALCWSLRCCAELFVCIFVPFVHDTFDVGVAATSRMGRRSTANSL